MKKITNLLITASLLMAFEGCAQNGKQNPDTTKAEYHKISAAEAKKMLDDNPKIILLDVRTEAEHKENRIHDSVLLPVSEIESKAAEVLPDKEAVIIVYCRSGRRSLAASNMLISMGYINVYDMDGGINGWGYKTEK
jgi:rhodanese-related sulfurtransferase